MVPILNPALLHCPFVLLPLIDLAFNTHPGVQTREVIPFPGILVPLSPPAVSRIMALEEDSNLPLMLAVGVVRAVGAVYPDDLVVGHDLVPVPSYEESQASLGL